MVEVGLSGYKSKSWGSPCYKITPTGSGMGDKRLKSMEIMVKHLKACGWDCSYWYQMD